MRIPVDASPAVQQAFRDVATKLDQLGVSHAENTNFKGRRIINAGEALADSDYVTLGQVNDLLGIAKAQAVTEAVDASTTTPPTDEDDGMGAQGCSLAGANGHPSCAQDAICAGMIVCGTGNEFSALKMATSDQATRDANQEQLLLRMIWHLNAAGFTAGRQRNPSSLISGDKLTVQIAGVYRAYDVFIGVDFSAELPTVMNQVFPADYVAEAGIAD